jgi:hypothetical protein
MSAIPISDGYAAWYANRLWQLLPAIYRTMDAGPTPGAPGPLQELCNRIGAQAAVVRRNIDRLGENQSIETCDDWVIPYIGDLVATRLVSCLDAPAQRLDVAKTIYYRRRAGTVGVLEELAADIASRDARVVEFFRRMGRTRHQFDPPLSYSIESPLAGPVGFGGNTVQQTEGLMGAYSGTPAGGFADLRNVYAASNTGSAFDEYAYTADLRSGAQTNGHFNIRNLGVFLWWLQAFPITAATPVNNQALLTSLSTTPCFTFDPTGRDIPLFTPSQRIAQEQSWGQHWVSPNEWELQLPIREALWNTVPDELYSSLIFAPKAFSIGLLAGGTGAPLPAGDFSIYPERGRFSFTGPLPALNNLAVCYNFGLSSQIGAGGYDSSILSDIAQPDVSATVSGGDVAQIKSAFAAAFAGAPGDANIQIADTLTYAGPGAANVANGTTVVLSALSGQRPVLRFTGAAGQSWEIACSVPSGEVATAVLVLEGILVQGADVVLSGAFDTVYLRMMTLDPGTSYQPPADSTTPPPTPLPFFDTAIDGLALSPTTLYIEAAIANLVIERSITGPIRTRNGGAVEQLTVTDSILQSIPTHTVTATPGQAPVIFDPASLASSLMNHSSAIPVTLPATPVLDFTGYQANTTPSASLITAMSELIQQLPLTEAEAAWPLALADLALGMPDGTVSLSRCTVMGPTYSHILQASESILDDVAQVDDDQAGCVRFSAYAAGSNPHQPYRSVQVAPKASIFESRRFGQPQYAKLLADADSQILVAGAGGLGCDCSATSVAEAATILEGAQNGSEMGAYCLEGIALKRRGLALKFEEYAPIGQLPVWIDAD